MKKIWTGKRKNKRVVEERDEEYRLKEKEAFNKYFGTKDKN